MNIVTLVLSLLLGLVFVRGGVGLLRGQEPMAGAIRRLGVRPWLQRLIGVLKVLGGVGVVAGLLAQPLGVAAAIGIAALMVGAVACHAKAGNGFRAMSGAVVMLVLAGAVAALQVAIA